MNVIVGSNNEPKRRAVSRAFARVYTDHDLTVRAVAADSGVSSHPITGTESLRGAINRAQHARELVPGADYYVGIEGGLLQVEERAWELGWVAVQNSTGKTATALSAGLELRGEFLEAILRGQELTLVLEASLGIKSLGAANGFYGLVTDDLVTRESAYIDAIVFALAQFNHPEYFEDSPGSSD